MARLDFRLVPDLTAQIVVELLREHLDVRGFRDIEIIELGSAPLAKSSAKSRVARAVIESTAEVYGKPPVIYPMDPSSGPVGAVCGVSDPRRRWRHLERATPAQILTDQTRIFASTIF